MQTIELFFGMSEFFVECPKLNFLLAFSVDCVSWSIFSLFNYFGRFSTKQGGKNLSVVNMGG